MIEYKFREFAHLNRKEMATPDTTQSLADPPATDHNVHVQEQYPKQDTGSSADFKSKSSLSSSLNSTTTVVCQSCREMKYDIRSRSELLRKAKEINVPVHGSVNLTLMAQCFIDNKYFQRLKYLKQLGTCNFIFPGATHTRFEHSVGTYYLADRLMQRILTSSDNCRMTEWLDKIPELKSHYQNNMSKDAPKGDVFGPGLNMWVVELIKIAALCHDVGHGPYSHLFDDVFIKNSNLSEHPMATHESRSCEIVARIVKESEILSKYVTNDDVKFIQSLIDPPQEATGFVYQIVSNNLNGLDVDKYDYINRDALHTGVKSGFDFARLVDAVLVIDDKICYTEQANHDIYTLFTTRHEMHRRVYGHKGVVSAQYIMIDIMKILDKVIKITESITDLNRFVQMTDDYILNCMNIVLDMRSLPINPFKDLLTETDYERLADLQHRVQTHDLYSHVGTLLTREKIDVSKDFVNIDEDDPTYMIHKSKVGFVSGNKLNPLDRIYVYKTKDLFMNGHNVKAKRINKTDITHIIPDTYQEYITMVYRRDRDIEALFRDKEVFQRIRDSLTTK
ncbi:HD phosphohydrolase [Yasminevirus sp. GU-2018]|uniref:HD phosphohydrolase n=1 Tax=Yasminevirus sp. GU-2018 TaxID=2420051 RepID=A0A5K0U996_9VIRU|nr:HD phosphohydrolase [Yasminevirus sp. GU-2018]